VNDAHGYGAGDRLLRGFVDYTKQHLRGTDLLFRYRQGDEFLILFKGTPAAAAGVAAERLRRGVAASRFDRESAENTFGITVSVGIVGYDPRSDFRRGSERPDPGHDADELLERAGAALAVAKLARNATWIDTPSDPVD